MGKHGEHRANWEALKARVLWFALSVISMLVFFSIAVPPAFNAIACEYSQYRASQIGPRIADGECWRADEIAMRLDDWADLDEGARMEVLQAVADREASRLALPFRPIVTSGEMDAGVIARCVGFGIVMNDDFPTGAGGGWQCARTVAHEAFHLHQHCCVDGLYDRSDSLPDPYPSNEEIRYWRWEFSHYSNDPSQYWTQKIEVSARRFSKDETFLMQAEAREAGYESINYSKSFDVLM